MFKLINATILWLAFFILIISFIMTGEYTIDSFLNQGPGIVSIFVLASTYTYNSFSSIFVWVNQRKMEMFNPTVHWSMQFEFFSKEFESNIFNELFDKIYEMGKDVKIVAKDEKQLFLRIDQINIEIFVDNEEDAYLYTVYFISDISYRDSLKNFYVIYEEYLNIIKTNIHKPYEEQYILKLKFKEHNPFYKVYLKRIDKPSNMEFSMRFNDESNEYVIRKNEMQVISKSLVNIKDVSSKYIAVSNKNLLK